MSGNAAAGTGPRRFTTLAQWLAWQEQLHPETIDLGLERIRCVADKLGLLRPKHVVISVGGTNGKGSCVAFLEAMLRAAGYRVGAYTSPHLLRYNERIRVDGAEVGDAALCQAFRRVEAARHGVSLTFFEFGTLAALEIFRQDGVDVAVLEVGLGGRLDAVNCLEADAAVVTTVDLDHQQWLGPDREHIGREKAGIYRAGRPAICADPKPPESLLETATGVGAALYRVGQDYGFAATTQGWRWWHANQLLSELPVPSLKGSHQLSNAAAALMTLASLGERLSVSRAAICEGLTGPRLAARCQILPGVVEHIIDVAHNPQGATALAQCLRERACRGRTHGVLGMLADKDVAGVVRAMAGTVDRWYAASVNGPRGLSAQRLAAELRDAGISVAAARDDVPDAIREARREAVPGDRIIVFGSFHTAADALELGVRMGAQPC